jgi:hypothetical protein
VLAGIARTDGDRSCAPGETYIVAGPGTEGTALVAACRPGALEPLTEAPVGTVYRCGELRPGDRPARIVARNRFEAVARD